MNFQVSYRDPGVLTSLHIRPPSGDDLVASSSLASTVCTDINQKMNKLECVSGFGGLTVLVTFSGTLGTC